MRRVTSVFLCLLSVAFTAHATGVAEPAPEQASENITLSFYRYANAAHDAYGIPLIEAFEAENNRIQIEPVEVSSGGFEALASKVLLGLAAGAVPDVIEMGYTLTRTMVESERVVPLDPFIANDTEFRARSLSTAMMNLGVIGGKQYLMPLGVSTPVMFINADLFREVGLDPANPPKTWQETRDAAEVLKDAGYDGVIWSWTTTGNWIFQNMVENAGGKLANEDASEIYFAEEPGIETMEYLYGLVADGLMPVTDQVVQTFYTGRLGMIVLSSFNRERIPSTAEFEVVMAEMPTPRGDLPSLAAGGKGYMMLAPEGRQEPSWQFIRFLASETAGRIVAENSGYTPPNLDIVAKLSEENAADPMFVLTLGQATRVVPWYSWPGENGARVTALLTETQESILLGEVSPREGLEGAAAQAMELLR